jgi:hypothetical protein
MPSESQVIVYESLLNTLTQIDLRTHKILYYNFKFIAHNIWVNLHTFSETNILCIEEAY